MNQLPDETKKRFVAVLNKKMDTGRTVNVLGHISVGLSNLLTPDEAIYVDYQDKDSNLHRSISHYPFIVLKAGNSNKLRKLREDAISKGITFTAFVHTMVEGGSTIQQLNTQNTPEAELEYLGVCLFGDTEAIRVITKKFSLYQ